MVGERLAELRKQSGFTQKQLAEALSVSVSTISLYEREAVSPDDELKIKIAQMFGVSLDYLMGLSDVREIPDSNAQLLYIQGLPSGANEELRSFLAYLRKKYHLSDGTK